MKTTILKSIIVIIGLILAQSGFGQSPYKNSNEKIKIENLEEPLKAEITITDSETKRGYKNLELKLSNGIIFTYEDGNYKSSYKNRALDVKGNYSINSEIGRLSLAFNADDGSMWWVFRKRND